MNTRPICMGGANTLPRNTLLIMVGLLLDTLMYMDLAKNIKGLCHQSHIKCI